MSLLQKRPNQSIQSLFRGLSGFTLIEVMIVVGLIAIFTAIGLGTGGSTNDQVAFFRDQAKIVQAIYQAREFATATKGNYCGYGVSVQDATTSITIVRVIKDAANNTCHQGTAADPIGQSQIETEKIVTTDTRISVPSVYKQFTLLFVSPFDTQAMIPTGASPCFIITSQKGLASSTVRINAIGQPQINPATPCN